MEIDKIPTNNGSKPFLYFENPNYKKDTKVFDQLSAK